MKTYFLIMVVLFERLIVKRLINVGIKVVIASIAFTLFTGCGTGCGEKVSDFGKRMDDSIRALDSSEKLLSSKYMKMQSVIGWETDAWMNCHNLTWDKLKNNSEFMTKRETADSLVNKDLKRLFEQWLNKFNRLRYKGVMDATVDYKNSYIPGIMDQYQGGYITYYTYALNDKVILCHNLIKDIRNIGKKIYSILPIANEKTAAYVKEMAKIKKVERDCGSYCYYDDYFMKLVENK